MLSTAWRAAPITDGGMMSLEDPHSCLVGRQFLAPATQHFAVGRQHVLCSAIVLHHEITVVALTMIEKSAASPA